MDLLTILTTSGLILGFFITFIAGAFCMLMYMILRMLKSKGWDDSNITNGLRLLSHVSMHPQDAGKMYYLTAAQKKLLEDNGHTIDMPFWYISKDEFKGVVKTRPTKDHV